MKTDKNKILYVRVPQNLYENVVASAESKGLSIEKYLTSLLLNYNLSKKPDITGTKRNKVIYCRMTTKRYERLKAKAAQYNMNLSEYVLSVLTAQSPLYKEPFEKVLYCRVSDEEHLMISEMAKEKGCSISEYVRQCLSDEMDKEGK